VLSKTQPKAYVNRIGFSVWGLNRCSGFGEIKKFVLNSNIFLQILYRLKTVPNFANWHFTFKNKKFYLKRISNQKNKILPIRSIH